MQIIKNRLAILTLNPDVLAHFAAYEPFVFKFDSENFENSETEILILDAAAVVYLQNFSELAKARAANRIKKIVLLASGQTAAIPIKTFNDLAPDLTTDLAGLQSQDLLQLFTETQQAAQNNAYLLLANELNTEYEKIKRELEDKLHDKTRNLIESRQKVYEVNSRIEFLRKVLYTISEIKTLDTAEEKLNQLLATYNKVTWFKIISANLALAFDADLENNFDSAVFKTSITVPDQLFFLYFFKGDKKPFKKSDILLFKKLTETLQINLIRIANLQNLKKDENFFDLAFHSSKNPILVIDQNYQVQQANNSALDRSKSDSRVHCYELLFNRSSKCQGCQLGKDFQIQENNSFFDVHSQPLSLMEHEDNQYWVHVYEDTTEQNLYEKKLSQFARLEELGLISSSIAHELNNPLGGILSFLQIMKMEAPAGHAIIHDLNLMQDTALRMKKIIEDLLIFSRPNQNIALENIDIYKALQNSLSLFELQFKVEKIKLSFLPPAIPLVGMLSRTLFNNCLNLIFEFFLTKAIEKNFHKHSSISLVEVKISQDQMNTYLSFASNSGPFEDEFKTKNLNLLAIEKALTDQGFQLFITEPAKNWIQLSILFSKEMAL